MSSTTSSVGGSAPGKSISGLLFWLILSSRSVRWSVGVEDVHDEDEGLLLELVTLAAPVAQLGRDHQHDAAADGLPDEPLVPALDDLAGAALDRERLAPLQR